MGINIETLIRLQDADEFDQLFIEQTRVTDTYEEAYALSEYEYRKAYNFAPEWLKKKYPTRRYASYESFRVNRHNRIKRKQKNVST